jgi:hypothetical protein
MTEPKKAGRPPKHGDMPMTPKQRASEYRHRRREAATTVSDDLSSATTRALLDGLGRRLATLEDPATTPEIADGARWVAGRIIQELCDRHKITAS